MTTLARFSVGRILLHLLAILGDRCVRFHFAGIMREIAAATAGYGRRHIETTLRARCPGRSRVAAHYSE
jgi:hypothetical protein